MKNIFKDYIDNPYFEIKVSLENGFNLFMKWNIFNDKKDGDKLVMRTRYILKDKDNIRCSLKVLNLKEPVEFKQIYLGEDKIEILESDKEGNDSVMFIGTFFSSWINNEFKKMINSGNCKILSFEIIKNKYYENKTNAIATQKRFHSYNKM